MNIVLDLLTYVAGGIGGWYFVRERRFLFAYMWVFCAGQVSVLLKAEDYYQALIRLLALAIWANVMYVGDWLYRRYGESAPPSNNKS